jgi:hypothetical protein
MTKDTTPVPPPPGLVSGKQPWEEPCVILERALEAQAAGGPPHVPWDSPLGALGTSGGAGLC